MILDLFRELNEKDGQTIIMVTHEEWHEEYMCRMIVLSDGSVSDQRDCRRPSGRREPPPASPGSPSYSKEGGILAEKKTRIPS